MSNDASSSGRSPISSFLVIGVALLVYLGVQQFMKPKEVPAGPNTTSAAHAGGAASLTEGQRQERALLRQSATLRSPVFEASIDNLGGGLVSMKLLGRRFREHGRPMDLVTTDREEYRPLRIRFPGAGLPETLVYDLEEQADGSVKLRYQGQGLSITRHFELGRGPHQIWSTTRVENISNQAKRFRYEIESFHYVRRADESSGFFSRSNSVSQGICYTGEEVIRKERDPLKTRHGYGNPSFVGVENAYFVQALASANEPAAEFCGLQSSERGNVNGSPDGSLFEARLVHPITDLPPGQSKIFRTLAYVGPKDWPALEAAGHHLVEVVNLGTFAVIARQFSRLLGVIQTYVGNWGLAIILLTILVRLAIYPLMAKQFAMMAKMRPLKPEMDKITAKYPDDMQARNAATMELYKKHGVNPLAQMAGCLPVLLQMPIFLALYASLSTNIELFHSPFALWWTDLSAPDPFFVLPALIVILMFVQQKMTPTQMDPQQAKMMLYMMPAMMGLFSLFLPAGLGLYWVTSSGISLLQQRFNEWRLSKLDAPLST